DALDLLSALVRAATGRALRFLCAYRDTETLSCDALPIMLADLAQARLVRHASLETLSRHEARELLHCLMEDRETLSSDETELLLDRSGGIPFSLVSFVDSIIFDTQAGRPKGAVPWDVAQGIRGRVALLPPL